MYANMYAIMYVCVFVCDRVQVTKVDYPLPYLSVGMIWASSIRQSIVSWAQFYREIEKIGGKNRFSQPIQKIMTFSC